METEKKNAGGLVVSGLSAMHEEMLSGEMKISLKDENAVVIKKIIADYTAACCEYGTVPTLHGLAGALGHSSGSLLYHTNNYPQSEVTDAISRFKDWQAHYIINTSFANPQNAVFGMFLLKSSHGYIDKPEITIKVQQPNVLGDKLSDGELDKIAYELLPEE